MNGVHSFGCNSQNIHGEHDHDHDQTSPRSSRGGNNSIYKHRSADNCFPFSYMSCSPLPRNSTPQMRSISRKSSTGSSPLSLPFLGKNLSRRNSNNILFSNSSGLLKPPAIEKKLKCTLEELCYGCQKKIKITRDVVKHNGKIVQEEELLTIQVKPGWKSGTKITFEGMGNEKLGTSPADITFVIAEKRHQLFRREGDDLELAIKIPLVKALTGCSLSIPLLGGDKMSLSIDDIIYPGFEKIIHGRGMPIPKDQDGRRGNLKVAFLVDFPTQLTDEQRSDVLSILQETS
ncbi:dnaJ homolog subfamily B member 13 [Morus notabilis]|nr:dnaJ homolog subfamily B member 13 [Morus notabilis]